ncbi:MbtH family protein [Micromonospora sp. LOL_014]|uniref:MbtH family protein n=1 Tax=Micromonospora sp. LOL_014 TaxID=3345415 RepID=UPI003A8933AA
MSNPFDDDGADFAVLSNAAGQQSLWPANLAVPGGWEVVHGPTSRAECLAYVDATWTDQRPRELADYLNSGN